MNGQIVYAENLIVQQHPPFVKESLLQGSRKWIKTMSKLSERVHQQYKTELPDKLYLSQKYMSK